MEGEVPPSLKSYVVKEGGGFDFQEIPTQEVGPHDIYLDIHYCGICASDFYYLQAPGHVLGHEIVGTVKARGSQVKNVSLGDVVGVGWQRSSCGICALCLEGWDNLCRDRKGTIQKGSGGYSSGLVVPAKFAFKLPAGLSHQQAAPLMCAGATVYGGLEGAEAKPGQTVGVVGIGGLGHLALQFSKAFGCRTVAITRSLDKEDECRSFGASDVITIEKSEKWKSSMDVILVTVAGGNLPYSDYLSLLKPRGTMVLLGIPEGKVTLASGFISRAQRIIGSMVGSPIQIERMLRMAVQHNIQAQIEETPMEQVSEAIKRVKANNVRYRMVLRHKL